MSLTVFISKFAVIAVCLALTDREAPLLTVPDPQAALKTETAQQSRGRHATVARSREGTVVILHRGAWACAPENTLSAIRAGFELGANGVELDFRRTKDGVIVLLHDDRIERMLDGVGSVEQVYYEELLLHTFRSLPAPTSRSERVPTLRDALQLVRDHAGLLHLDIKKAGIDDELLDELRKADMLDHVVTYNNYNSEAFRRAAIPKLRFKGSLMDRGADTQPSEAERLLKRPGEMAIVDDPRALLTVMGRPAVGTFPKSIAPLGTCPPPSRRSLEAVLRGAPGPTPVRLAAVRMATFYPSRLCELAAELCRHSESETRRAVAWNLGMIAKHRPELISDTLQASLLRLLADPDTGVRSEAAVACGRARIEAAVPLVVRLLADRPDELDRWQENETRAMIEARARYAFALGLLGTRSPAVTEVLAAAVKHRAMHRDLMLVGLDGAMAAWALGELRAAESVTALREALLRDDPPLEKVRTAAGFQGASDSPARWWDSNMHTFILPTLARIGSGEALHLLETALDPARRIVHPYQFQGGAEALLNVRTTDPVSTCARLLKHKVPEVRRAAILTCLKRSDPPYRALLESAAPWAVSWWDAQHGTVKK